jgi:hypothetical protein
MNLYAPRNQVVEALAIETRHARGDCSDRRFYVQIFNSRRSGRHRARSSAPMTMPQCQRSTIKPTAAASSSALGTIHERGRRRSCRLRCRRRQHAMTFPGRGFAAGVLTGSARLPRSGRPIRASRRGRRPCRPRRDTARTARARSITMRRHGSLGSTTGPPLSISSRLEVRIAVRRRLFAPSAFGVSPAAACCQIAARAFRAAPPPGGQRLFPR